MLAMAGTLLTASASAGGCNPETIREGRAGEITGATTFRLTDGQDVQLAAILPGGTATRDALSRHVQGRAVTLRGAAIPDRYGRLVALVYVENQTEPVQTVLVRSGEAVVSGFGGTTLDCVRDLLAAEQAARGNRRNYWSETAAIKNAERADDISPWIGQFVVAEGKIASVREAGGTVYVNFGRRWTRDFAVVISKRQVRGFEAAGIGPKTLEGRVVRVRGFVEERGGPRIEAFGPEQIELVR